MLGLGFLYGLWKLYDLRFAAGDIYPAYSSLRADPLGTKALYEGLRRIPGVSCSRNYRDVPGIARGTTTVLFLGQNPFSFEAKPEDQIKELEALAASGARVVIAMRPVSRVVEKSGAKSGDDEKAREASPIEKRWGVRLGYLTRPAKQAGEETNAMPKQSALYFRSDAKVVYRFERPFGSGAIVLLANGYPLSNEALVSERDTRLLAWILGSSQGPKRQVVFDERHLGLAESDGIVTLARKYHLEPLAAMLVLLLALFIWKSSTSLLPPRVEAADAEEIAAAKDVRSGLANLLRRNIPAKKLMPTCLEEWEASRHEGKFYSQARVDRIRSLARREGDVVETYRGVSRILAERSDT
jgi:hypothetical protein